MTTRDRILHLLKTDGPQRAQALARRLHVTAVAVRQHLERLLEEGVVECEDAPEGVGRPKRTWRLTAASASRFPDSHGELAVGMIAAARAAFGEAGLSRLIDERTAAQLKSYRLRMPARSAPLAARVAALAKIRDQEGYLASSAKEKDGTLTLVESHCPIGSAAHACRGLCDGELRLFRTLLGPSVRVERTEHVLSGGRRCAYRVVATERSGTMRPE